MEKNDNKVLYIIIGILLLIIGVGAGYIIGSNKDRVKDNEKVLKTNENIEEKKNEKQKESNLTENDDDNLEKNDNDDNIEKKEQNNENENKKSVDSQINYFIWNIYSKYTDVLANDLTNKEKLELAYFNIYDSYNGKDIPKENMKEEIERLFGKDTTYKDEDIYTMDLKELVASYDKESGYYKQVGGIGRGSCFDVNRYDEIISKNNNGNIITVETAVVYTRGCTGPGPLIDIYKDNNLKEKINVEEKYCDREISTDYCAIKTEEFFKDYKDKLNKLTYIFEVKDGIVTFKELKSK